MAISYSIDREKQIVYSVFSGHVSNEEIIDYQNALRRHPDFHPGMRELLDCSEEQEVESRMLNVLELVKTSPWGADAKRAIVATTPLIFGTSRVFQTLITPQHGNVNVFRDRAAAEAWLNGED